MAKSAPPVGCPGQTPRRPLEWPPPARESGAASAARGTTHPSRDAAAARPRRGRRRGPRWTRVDDRARSPAPLASVGARRRYRPLFLRSVRVATMRASTLDCDRSWGSSPSAPNLLSGGPPEGAGRRGALGREALRDDAAALQPARRPSTATERADASRARRGSAATGRSGLARLAAANVPETPALRRPPPTTMPRSDHESAVARKPQPKQRPGPRVAVVRRDVDRLRWFLQRWNANAILLHCLADLRPTAAIFHAAAGPGPRRASARDRP